MNTQKQKSPNLTYKIMIAMGLGMLVGLAIRYLTLPQHIEAFLVESVLQTGGTIFITILKMLVVPVVLVSLICGSSSLEVKRIGRVGGKALLLYLFTTALAISLALCLANLIGVGEGMHLTTTLHYAPQKVPAFKEVLLRLFPSNPFKALSEGEMMQIILFALLLGIALTLAGKPGQRVLAFFKDLNHVIMKLVIMVMEITPYGVFCLISALFARQGIDLVQQLIGYFVTILLVLGLHLFISYGLLLRILGRLNPIFFFKKMYAAMLFAFSVSSSNASIPVVLETVEDRLGVKNSVASFVIPLGATINMDGTAIMQGVATVFIAHAYSIHLGLTGYLVVVGMATLASIGTAGVPSVGLITLAMVLRQVGLPVEGIGLIIGVDRLLDMTRTAVNVSGDAMVACLVGKSEKCFDESMYNDPNL